MNSKLLFKINYPLNFLTYINLLQYMYMYIHFQSKQFTKGHVGINFKATRLSMYSVLTYVHPQIHHPLCVRIHVYMYVHTVHNIIIVCLLALVNLNSTLQQNVSFSRGLEVDDIQLSKESLEVITVFRFDRQCYLFLHILGALSGPGYLSTPIWNSTEISELENFCFGHLAFNKKQVLVFLHTEVDSCTCTYVNIYVKCVCTYLVVLSVCTCMYMYVYLSFTISFSTNRCVHVKKTLQTVEYY